jgi:hypothetical protein
MKKKLNKTKNTGTGKDRFTENRSTEDGARRKKLQPLPKEKFRQNLRDEEEEEDEDEDEEE